MRTDKWLVRGRRKFDRFRESASARALKPMRFLVSDEDAAKSRRKSTSETQKRLSERTVKEPIKD